MKVPKRIVAVFAVPLTALGVALAAVVPAHAAGAYNDASAQLFGQSIDAVTGITAVTAPAPPAVGVSVVGSPAVAVAVAGPAAASIKFGAAGSGLTWSLAANTAGATITSAGVLTLSATPVTAPVALTVEATDGTAVAYATVNVGVATGPGSNDSVSVTPDTVTLAGANDNTTGAVNFTVTPAAATTTLTLGNAPQGTAITSGALAATTAVPGAYTGVTVTARDAAGSVAVDTIGILVKGSEAPAVSPTTPRLYGGHAEYVSAPREDVYYVQGGSPSWDRFVIVGPGAINGHQGWVNGHLGLNEAVYAGLEGNHGYTVFYQPVTGPGSNTPVPGSHWGYVYFVS